MEKLGLEKGIFLNLKNPRDFEFLIYEEKMAIEKQQIETLKFVYKRKAWSALNFWYDKYTYSSMYICIFKYVYMCHIFKYVYMCHDATLGKNKIANTKNLFLCMKMLNTLWTVNDDEK